MIDIIISNLIDVKLTTVNTVIIPNVAFQQSSLC